MLLRKRDVTIRSFFVDSEMLILTESNLSSQYLLNLNRHTDREDCVSFVDGHKVLKTLQGINSLVDDGPKDEITTQVWAFARQGAQLSEDFIRGTQDFSDTSFIRGVDFSRPQEAEELVNSFVNKTSDGRVMDIFKDLNSSSDLLFLSSFNFQGLFLLPLCSSVNYCAVPECVLWMCLFRQLEDSFSAREDHVAGVSC